MNQQQLQETIDALIAGGAQIMSADNTSIHKLHAYKKQPHKLYLAPTESDTILIKQLQPTGISHETTVRYAGDNAYQLILESLNSHKQFITFYQTPKLIAHKEIMLAKPIPTLYDCLKQTM